MASTPAGSRPAPTSSQTQKPTAAATERPASSQAACPKVDEASFDATQVVSAFANIYGSGHQYPPMPGGGGPGELPPVWTLPSGITSVAFTCVEGQVNGIRATPTWNGPAGNGVGPTRIPPWDGIAGIVDEQNAMFVVGIFLTDAEPADPAPELLDFTDKEAFAELAPLVGQVFFIGDGAGRRYIVPEGATRLFVGFADARLWVGKPGYYGNNAGQVEVTVAPSP